MEVCAYCISVFNNDRAVNKLKNCDEWDVYGPAAQNKHLKIDWVDQYEWPNGDLKRSLASQAYFLCMAGDSCAELAISAA